MNELGCVYAWGEGVGRRKQDTVNSSHILENYKPQKRSKTKNGFPLQHTSSLKISLYRFLLKFLSQPNSFYMVGCFLFFFLISNLPAEANN